ncbi:ABC transporter permease [Streptomyces sp. DSM 42041]|uniref:ABC transporter permease n=1 Tax=Streptomyces hazeniae TaxID=3075538 RepID=A0ABU2NLJ1_9ACTN|nr:ABC transporter permease [Streptomyces sp. DSM 42041]MDT0377844.1 ABC transporter permease [Streptomyces sp. DSM 42041]
MLARTLWGLRAYGFIVRMWVRSALAYRASFLMMTLGGIAMTSLDFVAIVIMFTHIEELGGFSLPEVAFLYGASSASFGLADLLAGSFGRVGGRVRDGTVDVLLVRPVPVSAQVAADRFALHRVGRLIQAGLLLGWALWHLEAAWTPGRVLMVPVMVVSGALIFAAVFAVGGAFQFWARDASEVQNAFTYGGQTMLQYPPTVFGRELVRGATFVVPLAFVNWVPALYVLGRGDLLGLPWWADFASPAVALVSVAVAGLVWRAGLRGYVSTGS